MERETKLRVDHRTREMVFTDFIQRFSSINNHSRLFPKRCRTCGKKYPSLYDYIHETESKGQSMEDVTETFGRPFTMIYRNCSCGNTLVISITDEILTSIDVFWKDMRELAAASGQPLGETVESFMEEWERTIRHHFNLISRRKRF
ncbi:MAG: hypothetical protein ACP5U1_01910 [Desulfomonilaceae bacterium]